MGSRVQRGYFDYRNNNAVPGRTLRQFGGPTGSMTVNINAMDSKSIGTITLRSPTRWPWQCSAAVRLFSVSSFQTLAKGTGLWERREIRGAQGVGSAVMLALTHTGAMNWLYLSVWSI